MPTSPVREDERGAVWIRRRLALGNRIRSLRIERNLTQEKLALLSGISRNMLIQVEHGQRGILTERLGDLAEVLGCASSDLLAEPNEVTVDADT